MKIGIEYKLAKERRQARQNAKMVIELAKQKAEFDIAAKRICESYNDGKCALSGSICSDVDLTECMNQP